MTTSDCALALAALLIIGALFVAAIATTDVDPCAPDCRARFDDPWRN